MEKNSNVSWVFFGFILGIFSFALTILISNSDGISSILEENGFNVLSTVATLLAGVLAYIGIQQQIKKSDEYAKRENIENLRAARAMLPVALSNITETCRKNLDSYLDIGGGKTRELFLIDSDSLLTVKECIKYADDVSGERLSQILRIYQILLARHKDRWFLYPLKPHKRNDIDIDFHHIHQIVNWAVLDAICGSAYSFARGASQTIPKTIEVISILGSFHIKGADHEDYPILFDFVEELQKSKTLEMTFDGR